MQTHMAAARVALSEARTVCYRQHQDGVGWGWGGPLLLPDFRLHGPPSISSPLVKFIPINNNIAFDFPSISD